MTILAFVDYENLDYNGRGFVVTTDHIIRVRSFLLAAEKAWEKNWTFGQDICLDEYGAKGAQSRFCPITMFNKDKPIKHHIDLIFTCCPQHDYPARMHVFQKTGARLADVVMEHCWNPEWNGKNKVLYLFTYQTPLYGAVNAEVSCQTCNRFSERPVIGNEKPRA